MTSKKTELNLFIDNFSIIKDFEVYLQNEDKSENTISSYIQTLKGFFEYCQYEKEGDFESLDRMFITEYKGYLSRAPRLCKPKTINAKLSALSEFNRFLISKGINEKMEINKKDFMKIQEDYLSPATLTYEDVENIRRQILVKKDVRLKKVKESKGTQFLTKKKRDYLIVTMLAFSGLRVSELTNLYLKEFLGFDGTFDDRISMFEVRDGKGGKSRRVPLFPEVIEPLKSYIEARGVDITECPYLFTSRQNKKLDRTTVNKILKDYNINPHAFRHFFATYMLNSKEINMNTVKGMMGHSSLDTLAIYTHNNLEDVISKYNSK